MKIAALSLALCLGATGALGQEARPAAPAPAPAPPAAAAPSDPAMSGLRLVWRSVKDIVVRAAEKMPEENYSFRPAPEVRTFGQLAAHVADTHFLIGGILLGETPPAAEVEKTKTTKAGIVAALKDSVAYVDRGFAMGDVEAAKMVKLFGRDASRFSVFALAIGHGFEHYGNMVTYLRMKGLVPPTSEPRQAAPAAPADTK